MTALAVMKDNSTALTLIIGETTNTSKIPSKEVADKKLNEMTSKAQELKNNAKNAVNKAETALKNLQTKKAEEEARI